MFFSSSPEVRKRARNESDCQNTEAASSMLSNASSRL